LKIERADYHFIGNQMVSPDLSYSLLALAFVTFLVVQVNYCFHNSSQPSISLDNEQDYERITCLENAFKELAITESVLLTTEIRSLRRHIEEGGTWGKQKQKLQAQLKDLTTRRDAWSKAAHSFGDLLTTTT
jgi:hypothetical protein